MRTKLDKVFAMNNFFKKKKLCGDDLQYNLKLPSILLMNNIYVRWLQSIFEKTQKNLKIYTDRRDCQLNGQTAVKPFGYLDNNLINYNENSLLTHEAANFTPKATSNLNLNIFVPQQDSMQYFIQWQRYRKYWWSSVTTTPSLFAVNEINYENDAADASIVAKFPWEPHTVETIRLYSKATALFTNEKSQHMAQLSCSMSLECALLVLLLDGIHNSTKEECLRLHRSMAPYKISFALNNKDEDIKTTISDLAKHIHHRLSRNNISSFLPNFTLSVEHQIKENLQLGVAYTAVLCDNTLTTGIFNLLNSSTMLKEQVHLADFDAYAGYLFNHKY